MPLSSLVQFARYDVFVQLYTEEWGYRDCHAGKIVAGPKLASIVDLGNEIEKQTFGFLKKRKQ